MKISLTPVRVWRVRSAWGVLEERKAPGDWNRFFITCKAISNLHIHHIHLTGETWTGEAICFITRSNLPLYIRAPLHSTSSSCNIIVFITHNTAHTPTNTHIHKHNEYFKWDGTLENTYFYFKKVFKQPKRKKVVIAGLKLCYSFKNKFYTSNSSDILWYY